MKPITKLCTILFDVTAVMIDESLAFPLIENGDEIVIDLESHTLTINEDSIIEEVEVGNELRYIITVGGSKYTLIPLVPITKNNAESIVSFYE